MNKILHITPHLGGGVGKVLCNACDPSENNKYRHTIILLEQPRQLLFVNRALQNGIEVLIAPSEDIIYDKMNESDIVQIEWWNHPIICEFLYNIPQIPIRLVIWSHISGCSYPFIKKQFIKNCSRFLFTSPYSLENVYLRDKLTKNFISNNTDIVYSSGGFTNIEKRQHKDADSFNIGYVGTLNYCKLNPQFVDYCNQIKISNSKFIMVGDTANRDKILSEAKNMDIDQKFEFVGYVDDVQSQLCRFDVFGYLLNPEHYGTTENALLEAMAIGIPPIVLNQCTEKYLVKDMETGIVVNNKREYGHAIKYLYENFNERIRIGNNARKYVIDKFSLKNTVMHLNKNYDCVMKKDKRKFCFKDILGSRPSDWFLSCLGNDEQLFKKSIEVLEHGSDEQILKSKHKIRNCKQIFKEKNKSSIYHFQRCFQEDKLLKYWRSVLEDK